MDGSFATTDSSVGDGERRGVNIQGTTRRPEKRRRKGGGGRGMYMKNKHKRDEKRAEMKRKEKKEEKGREKTKKDEKNGKSAVYTTYWDTP